MNASNRKRWLGLILVFFVCMIGFSAPLQHFAAFPSELRLFSGQLKQLDYLMPVHAKVTVDPDVVKVNGSASASTQVDLNEPLSLVPSHSGTTEMKMKLFGRIPFKTVKLNVVPDLRVVPGGQTIGVKVKSDGIMVVGHHQVETKPGVKVSPGQDSDIRLGDLIVKVNGSYLNEVAKMSKIVDKAGRSGKPLHFEIKRGSQIVTKDLKPAYDPEDKAWRLGLYIRDSAAGVGTLTFYAPDQGVYGALGHVITDMDTQTPIKVGEGQVVQSSVTSINKSSSGEPGEKRAHFVKEGKVLGNVEHNTQFGIFGKMKELPKPTYTSGTLPVAFAEEVKEGPAQIYTVVGGQRVEKFNIEITHVSKQTTPATKGMVIKITDPKLLEQTGGIVQGMSGSPIIQNGKIVGAVTHVFVNDPSSGYGCYIEWMLRDAGILLESSTPQQNLKAG
ncbi:SpoIVB peptidase [Paenibacillus sambharensis]|uniref:SpoIVB peptidase n=1 Tax=Paenibacillus sambharensis TaxID=1803190 RepID=A0A2W1L0K4_9BACL|nr:SpoIVB peptidase [Paenibacillus sambharensis]PZD93448.1 SpoIVB peptidase [Paenibacillus sambharensis]